MQAKLVLLGDNGERTVYRLKKLPTVIGRGRDAGLTLAHPLVSRHHCELYEVENTLCVRDLGSLNGTFVGDFRITEAALASGDLLTLGGATFEIVVELEAGELLPPNPAFEPVQSDILDFEPAEDPLSDIDFAGVDDAKPSPPPARKATPAPAAAGKKSDVESDAVEDEPIFDIEPAPPLSNAAKPKDATVPAPAPCATVPAPKQPAAPAAGPAPAPVLKPKTPAKLAPNGQPAPAGESVPAAAGESRIDFNNLMAEEGSSASSSGSGSQGGDSGLNSFLRKLD